MKIISICVVFSLLFAYAAADACDALLPTSSLAQACDQYYEADSAHTRCEQELAQGQSITSYLNNYINTCEALGSPTISPNNLPANGASTFTVAKSSTVGQYCITITANTVNGHKTVQGTPADTFAVSFNPTDTAGSPTVTYLSNGQYQACFTPQGDSCSPTTKSFTFTISVTVNGGDAITGSPLSQTDSCDPTTSWGDPHFITDTRSYTYQGQGDYYHSILGNTIVQQRQGPCNYVGITCITGIAIKPDDGTRVEYFPYQYLRVNNVTLYTKPLSPQNQAFALSPAISAVQTSSNTIEFYFTGGAVVASTYGLGTGTFLNINLYAARTNAGGLLGQTGRQGQAYGADAGTIQPFGDSWRATNEADSIFYYNATYPFYVANPSGVPQIYNCSNIPAVANSSCSPLNSTSPLVAYCSTWIPDSPIYYSNCQCDVTWTQGDVGWAQVAIDNYIKRCRDLCFGCTIPNLPTSALTSYASGTGLTSPVNALTLQSFTIQACDILGNPRTTGGDVFTVVAQPTGGISFNVQYQSAGKYLCRYAASLDGNYTFDITFGGVPINGNPYPMTVIN